MDLVDGFNGVIEQILNEDVNVISVIIANNDTIVISKDMDNEDIVYNLKRSIRPYEKAITERDGL
jgi:hypothetical protein